MHYWSLRNTGLLKNVHKVCLYGNRYYGESLPFGKDSFKRGNIGYLSAAQALADYANLISSIKPLLKADHVPVISFGGSYGGTTVLRCTVLNCS